MSSDTKPDRLTKTGFRKTPAGELLTAIDQLASARCIEDVVDTVRATARKLLGSDGIAIILREGDHCHYVEEDAIGPLWKGGKFPMTSCISGWAMLNADTAIIPDIYLDDRIPHDLYRQTFVRSLVMAPVRVEDPIAAIGAYWASVYEPSQDEVDTLTTLAQAAGTAIENALLIDQLGKALADAELARDELRHRVKNAFSASQALARLTLPREQAASLETRIAALARAHDLLDQKLANETSVWLGDLVAAELEPYRGADADPAQLTFSGPPIELDSSQAIALGLALNELATNAIKYGALSVATGRLAIRWRMRGGYLSLDWIESDGPPVQSTTENTGSRLLKRLIEHQLAGVVRREMDPAGVFCAIEFPINQLIPRDVD